MAAIALSEDHKPNRSDERKRIENAGGVVMWAGEIKGVVEVILGIFIVSHEWQKIILIL